ncbi:MAG: cytochrome c biogenesis heme-transporting ATPase CcmA [Gammaproteobacteria bacterium]|nr:cytochrome c biogenesis heme-transporting ATPase CcmA [Gammaproteobacteria bacterium]MDH3408853.1 cytochrome c biogenesis heme-transporting ATPase CcmA [Gammaproteobacteria bacterium]MDH3553675.1 cytochrome c biogenesis heme-transporting ATPase CcmA [Gammaproteobacteria bacterium]
MTTKLSANDLTLFRGERCLFRHLSFALNQGELLLLEGRNGTGKTSLMRAIAGLISFEAGEIFWGDVPVLSDRQAFHGALVWMAHRVGFKADLTLVENLRFEANLRSQSGADFDEVLHRLDIDRLKRLPIRSLSAGQQRRVALARMLLSGAPLWLMDEPFTNLDREGRELVVKLTSEHLDMGGMCIMAAHQDVEIGSNAQKIVLQ